MKWISVSFHGNKAVKSVGTIGAEKILKKNGEKKHVALEKVRIKALHMFTSHDIYTTYLLLYEDIIGRQDRRSREGNHRLGSLYTTAAAKMTINH